MTDFSGKISDNRTLIVPSEFEAGHIVGAHYCAEDLDFLLMQYRDVVDPVFYVKAEDIIRKWREARWLRAGGKQ